MLALLALLTVTAAVAAGITWRVAGRRNTATVAPGRSLAERTMRPVHVRGPLAVARSRKVTRWMATMYRPAVNVVSLVIWAHLVAAQILCWAILLAVWAPSKVASVGWNRVALFVIVGNYHDIHAARERRRRAVYLPAGTATGIADAVHQAAAGHGQPRALPPAPTPAPEPAVAAQAAPQPTSTLVPFVEADLCMDDNGLIVLRKPGSTDDPVTVPLLWGGRP